MQLPVLRGRGVADNPQNRFEPLAYEPDAEERASEEYAPDTRLYRDHTKSILARNNSPDVPFDVSVNPYRGCEHGCVYCLDPRTPILYADMSWRPIGQVEEGDELVGFDEYPAPGRTRKFRKTRVEAVWWSRKPTLRLVTDQADVITTAEHRWLQARNFRWSRADQLAPGHKLRHATVTPDEPFDEDYRVGYVAGMTLGDGTFRYEPGWRSRKLGFPQSYWRVALADPEPLHRLRRFLGTLAIDVELRDFDGGASCRARMAKLETRSLAKLAVSHGLLEHPRDTRSYRRGFVAGFFDAAGHASGSLRISHVDQAVLERVRRYCLTFGFAMQLEDRQLGASTLRLIGSLRDRVRFFSVFQPVIQRKLDSVFGRGMNLAPEVVRAVEPGQTADVIDIQTSTGTFIAGGLATHNCYARPTHEYLGFSAGLDFESRILVKENAPALLRKALSAKSWKPQSIALSGNTDPYQPIERQLRITRGILEVLAEFRNPVGIITKNHLVTRDLDLLAELAAHQAAVVNVSVTTLDPELRAVMEPRTATPARRLDAIRAVADAGIPVGVMVAPVIPGLTDHELPAILEAAAEAGATRASWIPVRLPHAVAPLFEQWLADHRPERREKVLNRIREMRGGALNDARFGARMRGQGIFAEQTGALFRATCKRLGLNAERRPLSSAAFRVPVQPGGQLGLFS
ncbi:MAG: PA0069 family radical SAM protein [Gemmatimonadota bacterium]